MGIVSLRLYQDDEKVAWNSSNKGVSDFFYFTHSVNLIFTERNETAEDMPYKLCIEVYDEADHMGVPENMFQWGYKILGDGYKLVEHRFDGSALTREALN